MTQVKFGELWVDDQTTVSELVEMLKVVNGEVKQFYINDKPSTVVLKGDDAQSLIDHVN